MRTEEQILEEIDKTGIRINRQRLEEHLRSLAPTDHRQKLQISKLKKVLESLDENDRVHTKHVVRPDVGRVYVKGFNYTNHTKEYRDILLPEKGQRIVVMDAKCCELVVLAHMSEDAEMQEALREDIHQARADKEGISRQEAKVRNFAGVYSGAELPWEKANDLITRVGRQGVKTGVAKSAFGTERRFERDPENLAKAGRQAVSHTIQSTAAELIRRGLPLADEFIQWHGGMLKGMVFDSYVLSVPQDVSRATLEKLQEKLEAEYRELGYDLKLEISDKGDSWK